MNQFFTAPFSHWVQEDFLAPELLERADQDFDGLSDSQFLPHSTGYRFAICRDVEILKFLYSSEMRSQIEKFLGRKVQRSKKYPVPQYYEYPQNSKGLPAHTDADEKRDLAMIIYLNEDWTPSSGGELMVMQNQSDSVKAIAPVRNRMACLELHPEAWHAVNPTQGSFRRRTLIVDWDFV